MTPPLNLPWYSIYGAAVSASWLAAIVRRHAEAVAASARASDSLRAAERRREAQRFVTIDLTTEEDNSNSGDDDDEESVSSDAAFGDHLASAARRVFRIPSLRPKQLEAVQDILYKEETDGKLLVVDRTGGGKSLILQLTAVAVAGVTIVIVPLLSLTANQMARVSRASSKRMTVTAIHLDETSWEDVCNEVIPKMEALPEDTSSSLFLLCSPQYIAEKQIFRDALLSCNDRGLLRLVAIDEAHLFAMHGRSFREAIRVLADVFFFALFATERRFRPLFLAMTATMTERLLADFARLTHVDWTREQHQLWSSPAQFRQRYIDMDLHVTGDIKNAGLIPVVELMKQDRDARACVFVNFRHEACRVTQDLETLLSAELLRTAVLQVHGEMDKHEKFAFIRLFVAAIHKGKFNPRVLVATAAANTGIDAPRLLRVLRVGIPRCLVTLIQERGRNAREAGLTGMFVVITDWSMFVFLLLSILINPSPSDTEEIHDHFFANSMIKSQTPKRHRNNAQETSTPGCPSVKKPLTTAEKRQNRRNALDDLVDTINLLFLPHQGCIHLRCEWILHSKKNTEMPRWYTRDNERCRSNCYVCKGTYEKYILPIVFTGAKDFLASSHFAKFLAKPLSYDEPDHVCDSLWGNEDWRKQVFGKKTVAKYNVHAFFFQLTALRLINFVTVRKSTDVLCVLGRGADDKLLYKKKKNWKGLQFRSKRHGGARVAWEQL